MPEGEFLAGVIGPDIPHTQMEPEVREAWETFRRNGPVPLLARRIGQAGTDATAITAYQQVLQEGESDD